MKYKRHACNRKPVTEIQKALKTLDFLISTFSVLYIIKDL